MVKIRPIIDIAFKKIFGVEENKDLLISLINSIIDEQDQVIEIELLNPYTSQNFIKQKLAILDIKAKSQDGKIFNIEMQIGADIDYEDRALFYWSKLYNDQLERGNNYKSLSKTIGIHILNFTIMHAEEKYHNVYQIKERDNNKHYFKKFELHTIELNKFTKNSDDKLSNIIPKIKTSLDQWVAFLTKSSLLQEDNLPQQLDNKNIKKALSVLNVMNLNKLESEIYEDHAKWLSTEASILLSSQTTSKAEGKIEGKIEGKMESKIEIAKNLLKLTLTDEQIIFSTGLSEIDLKNIKQNL